jgi:hypothetical protein
MYYYTIINKPPPVSFVLLSTEYFSLSAPERPIEEWPLLTVETQAN